MLPSLFPTPHLYQASTGTQALLAWYDTNHRVLPWRRTPGSKRTEEEREKMGKGFRLDASREEFAYGES